MWEVVGAGGVVGAESVGAVCTAGVVGVWEVVGAESVGAVCTAAARRRDDFELFGGRGDAAGGWLAQVSAAVGAWEETEIADTAERTGARERRLCGEVGDFCGAFLIIKRG